MITKGKAEIVMLDSARWSFIGLEVGQRHRLARRLDRLARKPRPSTAQRLKGTHYVYRIAFEDVRLLYHFREDRITVLVLARQRTDHGVAGLLRAKPTNDSAAKPG